MSLYRQAGARRPWVAGVAALIGIAIGVVIGAAVWSGGGGATSLRDAVSATRARAQPVLNGLELVPVEYRQARAPSEYAAARADLGRARAAYVRIRDDVAVLSPAVAARVGTGLARLDRLVARRAPAAVVAATAGATRDELAGVLGVRAAR